MGQIMTDAERINRLEILVAKLASALYRQDSEQNGNWGWPNFHKEMGDIQRALASADEQPPLRRDYVNEQLPHAKEGS
jgi:hypothetical protein